MHRRSLLPLALLSLLPLAACEAGSPDDAAPAAEGGRLGTLTAADFAPVNRSGITGSVQVDGEGDPTVTLELVGLEPGAVYATHVHTGRCAAGGPVAIALGEVTAGDDGRGRMTTEVSTAEITTGDPVFVQAHGPGGEAVACADLGGGDEMPLTERIDSGTTAAPGSADAAGSVEGA